jgi:hypothetical protein
MYIASAYPNSALPALTMTVMALVIAGSLAAWLVLVFLADRQSRKPRQQQARPGLTGDDTALAAPDGTAEDEHRESDSDRLARGRGVAA